jgi:hypothetical protein
MCSFSQYPELLGGRGREHRLSKTGANFSGGLLQQRKNGKTLCEQLLRIRRNDKKSRRKKEYIERRLGKKRG